MPTYYAKAPAEDLPARLGRVIAVENRLIVMDFPCPYASALYVDEWRMRALGWYRLPPLQAITVEAAFAQEIGREIFWTTFTKGTP